MRCQKGMIDLTSGISRAGAIVLPVSGVRDPPKDG